MPEGLSQIELLPAPPAPVEEDLEGLQPTNETSVLVSGHWAWKGDRYLWRGTRFIPEPADFVWQPASYTWTPGGFLFVDGYWDRPLRQRGLLFAPAVFRRDTIVNRPGVYAPQFAVHPDFLETALFVRPAGKHYYFGDYFDPQDRARGVIPWPEYRTGSGALDPLFAHYRTYAPVANWEAQTVAVYAARFAGKAPRPPRTLVLQEQYVRTVVKVVGPGFVPPPAVRQTTALVAVSVIGQTGVKVRTVDQQQRNQYRQYALDQAEAAEAYRQQQAQLVAQQGGAAFAPKAPVTVKLAVKTARPAYLAPRAPGAPPPPDFRRP